MARSQGNPDSRDGVVAGVCAGLMIAHQVAGKATRDALFLSNYAVSDLPSMLIVAAAASLVAMVAGSRLLGRRGPAAVMPTAFALSAVLLFALAYFAGRAPRAVAVLFYLHFAAIGAVLISGFWSLVNERFDPRSAKRRIGRIAAGGTLGGLVGGLVAERAAAWFSADALLPLLGVLHLGCAGLLISLARRTRRREAEAAPTPVVSARSLMRVPLLRDLGALVLVGTVAAALLDYVFKAQATERLGSGESLLRFFALFYTAAALLGFVLQAGLSRRMLERLGLARTVAAHSVGVVLGGLANVLVPGFAAATLARGAESGLRNSLFRSGYETLFIPLPPAQKRAAKPYVDVGCERLGDATGGMLIHALLGASSAAVLPLLALGAGVLGGVGVWITRRVQRDWVRALERSLLDRGAGIDLETTDEATRTMVLRTMQSMELGSMDSSPSTTPSPATEPADTDPVTQGLVTLRGQDARAIRRLLEAHPEPPQEWIPTLISLLAWDEMSAAVARALRPIAARHTGQLVDALTNPRTDFAVRRRLPRVLSETPAPRVVEGLIGALLDARFEVRYQAGRALLRLQRQDASLPFRREPIVAALLEEVKVERRVWEGHRLLDEMPADPDSPFDEEMLRRRSNRSLEHVFTVLSTILPARPLGIAYQGLFTGDPVLRGTALEYLDSVLPPALREGLWPFLDEPARPSPAETDREQVLEDLLRSHASIQIRLRDRGKDENPSGDRAAD